MIKTNADAMAVIFPNNLDNMIPEIAEIRMIGSLPFASRYRVIDFYLSSLVNSGIDNITIMAKKNYHSLLDHIGSGREWDLVRKNGGITIFPPYAVKNSGVFNGWIEGLASIRPFLLFQKEEYIILTEADIVMNFDYASLLKTHIESGADVTILYNQDAMPEEVIEEGSPDKGMFYTLDLDGTRVVNIDINSRKRGPQNMSLNVYVAKRTFLIDAIDRAFMKGAVYLIRDLLIPMLKEMNVQGYRYDGYVARISDMKHYFRENMRLLEGDNLSQLFSGNPVFTKIRDDNPTRYKNGCSASNVLVADGCIIEGDIEDCILFRGVKIGKGAKLRKCILMQDTVVEDGAVLDHVIADKRVTISGQRRLSGSETLPIYIAKGQSV